MSSRISRPSRGRVLDPDELLLWRKVTENVVPSDVQETADGVQSFETMMRQYEIPQIPRRVNDHATGCQDDARGTIAPPIRQPSLGTFDTRHSRQISRGHVEIDAVLDLHGLRQDEAHSALKRFLVQSQARGARYVTVVTGKGRLVEEDGLVPSRERGVLRRVVRNWLEDADFRSLVVSYTTAARNHGGDGALFVHVRRANRPRKV